MPDRLPAPKRFTLLVMSFAICYSLIGPSHGISYQELAQANHRKVRNLIKCVVIEGHCYIKEPGTETVRECDREFLRSVLDKDADGASGMALAATTGRILHRLTREELAESGDPDAFDLLLAKIQRLPSGVYILFSPDRDDFSPLVGDTLDNAAGAGDFDGDGDGDIVLAGIGAFVGGGPPATLYFSDGAGGLIDASERLPQVGMNAADVVVFDADGDLDLDLFFVNTEERNRLFMNTGDGFFADESDTRISSDTLAHTSGDFADIDHDGDNDLLITGLDSPGWGELESYEMLLVNDGTGHFSDESASRFIGGTVLDTSMDGAFIDIESDYDPDIIIANDNFFGDRSVLYLNNGSGQFTDVTYARLPVLLGSSSRIGVGDLIPDQSPDIYIANTFDELNFLLENDGSGTFYNVTTQRTPYSSGVDSSWSQACAIMDVNLDGVSDIVVGNSYLASQRSGQNRVLLNNAYGFFTDFTDSLPSPIPLVNDDTFDLDALDANSDEKIDLFVTNSYAESRLYTNENGRLPVEEEFSRDAPGMPRAVELYQNFPNPFNPVTTIPFAIPSAPGGKQMVELVIYDIRGRHVKTLLHAELSPGSHRVVWNGRNDRGARVPSGIYLYMLKVGSNSAMRKMAAIE